MRDAVLEDCSLLAENLREDDIKEMSFYGEDILQSIQNGFRLSSKCKAIMNGDKLVGLYGVAPWNLFHPSYGVVWMLATPELDKIKMSFLRQAREELQDLFKGYMTLFNQVWSGNEVHIKWLEWMGFKIFYDKPVEQGQGIFYPFYKELKDV